MHDSGNPEEEEKSIPAVTNNKGSMLLGNDQKTNWPEIHKAYDPSQIMKGFKDRDFDKKEEADIEALRMALLFVKK